MFKYKAEKGLSQLSDHRDNETMGAIKTYCILGTDHKRRCPSRFHSLPYPSLIEKNTKFYWVDRVSQSPSGRARSPRPSIKATLDTFVCQIYDPVIRPNLVHSVKFTIQMVTNEKRRKTELINDEIFPQADKFGLIIEYLPKLAYRPTLTGLAIYIENFIFSDFFS